MMNLIKNSLICKLLVAVILIAGLVALIYFTDLFLFTEDIISALLSVAGGVLAGLVVFFILDYREAKHWRGSKEKLTENLNITINALLSTVRTAAGFDPPELLIKSDEEFLLYTKSIFGFGIGYGALKKNLSNMENQDRKTFLTNLYNMSETLKYMLTLFIGFRKADNWYVENIFKLNEKIFNASTIYYTFPEICDPQHKRKDNIINLEKDAIRNVVDLVDFAIKFKDQLNERL